MKPIKDKKKAGSQGSFTVELCILFTFILFVLFAFIFGIMLLYQNVFLQKAVNSAAMLAMETSGALGNPEETQSEAHGNIVEAVNSQMERSVFNAGDGWDMIEVKREDDCLGGSVITVALSQEVSIPLGQLKQLYSGKDTVTLKAQAMVVNDNAVQFIRNVDLVREMKERVWEWSGL